MVITLYRPNEKKFSQVGWRVRLLLEEKNLKFETRLIVLSQKEHEQEDIMRLNPRGELPIMQDEYCTLHEEASMLQYLEEYYPEPALMPSKDDRKRRSEVLVLFHESIGVFAANCRAVLSNFLNVDENPSNSTQNSLKEKVKEGKIIITNELTRWEKLLQTHNEQFLMGKDITMVDVSFFPYFAHLLRYGFSIKKMPRLESYYENMCKRTSVKRTWPSGWSQSTPHQWLK